MGSHETVHSCTRMCFSDIARSRENCKPGICPQVCWLESIGKEVGAGTKPCSHELFILNEGLNHLFHASKVWCGSRLPFRLTRASRLARMFTTCRSRASDQRR